LSASQAGFAKQQLETFLSWWDDWDGKTA